MIDHDTDSYYKISRAFLEGQPSGNLTREHIVDNITAYWLTGTGASAARSNWENGQATAQAAGQALRRTRSRSDSPRSPTRSSGPAKLGRDGLPTLPYFNGVDKGGHFAAWEEPELFATEMRAAFQEAALEASTPQDHRAGGGLLPRSRSLQRLILKPKGDATSSAKTQTGVETKMSLARCASPCARGVPHSASGPLPGSNRSTTSANGSPAAD